MKKNQLAVVAQFEIGKRGRPAHLQYGRLHQHFSGRTRASSFVVHEILADQKVKFYRFLVTLCRQMPALLHWQESFSQKYLCLKETAFFNMLVRYPG